jgi:hypothetical protein
MLAVPAGKRLVVEMIAVNGTVPPDQWPFGGIQVSTDGRLTSIGVRLERVGVLNSGSAFWYGVQESRMYADPGRR